MSNKSRRQKFGCIETPTVKESDMNSITIFIRPLGTSRKGVTFTMPWFQFRNFLRDVRQRAADQSAHLQARAVSIIDHVK